MPHLTARMQGAGRGSAERRGATESPPGPEGREGGRRYRGLSGEEKRVLVDAGHLWRALHDDADARQRQ